MYKSTVDLETFNNFHGKIIADLTSVHVSYINSNTELGTHVMIRVNASLHQISEDKKLHVMWCKEFLYK